MCGDMVDQQIFSQSRLLAQSGDIDIAFAISLNYFAQFGMSVNVLITENEGNEFSNFYGANF